MDGFEARLLVGDVELLGKLDWLKDSVGLPDLCCVGMVVGKTDGKNEGASEGIWLGGLDGLGISDRIWLSDGEYDGLVDGPPDGTLLGIFPKSASNSCWSIVPSPSVSSSLNSTSGLLLIIESGSNEFWRLRSLVDFSLLMARQGPQL